MSKVIKDAATGELYLVNENDKLTVDQVRTRLAEVEDQIKDLKSVLDPMPPARPEEPTAPDENPPASPETPTEPEQPASEAAEPPAEQTATEEAAQPPSQPLVLS